MTDLSTPEAHTPGLRVLASLTDLESYLELHMLIGQQSAKRQTRHCPNLRVPTRRR